MSAGNRSEYIKLVRPVKTKEYIIYEILLCNLVSGISGNPDPGLSLIIIIITAVKVIFEGDEWENLWLL